MRSQWLIGLGVVGLAALAVVAGPAPAARAHPLGNATINHYDGLALSAAGIVDTAVEDVAEIPTLQRKNLIDTNRDGQLSDAERNSYAQSQCAAMGRSTAITVNGQRLTLTVQTSSYTERLGAISLKAGRLDCRLTAAADLNRSSTIAVDSRWDSAGIGWHEITATGSGVRLDHSPFPAASISDELRTYPNDLLSSPLNVRAGSISTIPGSGQSTYAAAQHLPVAGVAVRALNRLANKFNELVGARHLSIGVGLLAVLLALTLGAGHAFLPGHGKTIMAAYLVGRRGRIRDVAMVGATVTVTHTAGVLVLGLLISVTTAFAPTAAEQYLGIVSGLLVAGVGLGLLVSAARRLRSERAPIEVAAESVIVEAELAIDRAVRSPELMPVASAVGERTRSVVSGHHHDHDHPHDNGHSHPHEHVAGAGEHSHSGDGHTHGTGGHTHGSEGHTHGVGGHTHGPGGHTHGPRFGRGGLIGLGVAGGLVPSPSALLVLLAAIGLGRTAFGIILVLCYGLGMALALSMAGLLLVKLRDRLARRSIVARMRAIGPIVTAAPLITASLVLIVGIGLMLRAANGVV